MMITVEYDNYNQAFESFDTRSRCSDKKLGTPWVVNS